VILAIISAWTELLGTVFARHLWFLLDYSKALVIQLRTLLLGKATLTRSFTVRARPLLDTSATWIAIFSVVNPSLRAVGRLRQPLGLLGLLLFLQLCWLTCSFWLLVLSCCGWSRSCCCLLRRMGMLMVWWAGILAGSQQLFGFSFVHVGALSHYYSLLMFLLFCFFLLLFFELFLWDALLEQLLLLRMMLMVGFEIPELFVSHRFLNDGLQTLVLEVFLDVVLHEL